MRPAVDDEVDEAEREGGLEAAQKKKEACQELQRAWIKRKEAPRELGSCRPSKRHRLGAKHWCQGLDNTLRRSTPLGGLGAFALPPPEKRSGHWEAWPRWPHLLLTIDQGSDGLCGASFLRSQDINLSVLPDMSHAANNDFVDGCKDVGL